MTNVRLSPLMHAATVAGVLFSAGVHAQEDRLTLHGYGNQDYRESSANSYMGADRRGTWDNNFLGLVLAGTINDRSKVWAQVQANSTEQTRLTWMFVDYQFSNNLGGHVGRVKFPFGIYNETIDTKALQMTAVEPAAYSGAADMSYDAYNGVGLDYDTSLGSNGNLTLQGFFGNIYNPPAPTNAPPFSNPIDASVAPHNDRRIVGGKITWQTPIDGLRLMFSANRATLESTVVKTTLGATFAEPRWIASLDYVAGPWDLKSEYNHHTISGVDGFQSVTSAAWYLQAGYSLGNWTPYARYDSIVTDKSKASDPSFFQRTWVAGTNYRLNNNLNLRGEIHFNHGYALPVVAGETQSGSGSPDWHMLVLSANFMF